MEAASVTVSIFLARKRKCGTSRSGTSIKCATWRDALPAGSRSSTPAVPRGMFFISALGKVLWLHMTDIQQSKGLQPKCNTPKSMSPTAGPTS